MSDYQFSVDLGGMISILSDHLYSSPDTFLRELLQNAADAVSLRKRKYKSFKDPAINVVADGKSISFTDNGMGLTEEEVHKFVSVIGMSSKRSSGSYIGRFGIGLLSCFIVTDEIILRSRSAKAPDTAVEWHGFSDGRYNVSQIPADMPVGTTITFKSTKGQDNCFEEDYVEERLRYFGFPMEFPIYVSSDGVNMKRANMLFIREESKPGENGEKDSEKQFIMAVGEKLFGKGTEFLGYIPLNSPSGLFSGAAYILPFSVSAARRPSRHRIYLKSMLLTEDGTGLLPDWAFFLRCFINTDKLRPTASREGFYHNELLDRAKEEIAQCIADYLQEMALTAPRDLFRLVNIHGTALRSVACENEQLLKTFMPFFTFETTLGTVTGQRLLDSEEEICYISDIDIFRQVTPIFASVKKMVVNTCYSYERDLLQYAERLGLLRLRMLSDTVVDETLGRCSEEETKDHTYLLKIMNKALKQYYCIAEMRSFDPPQVNMLYSRGTDADLLQDIHSAVKNGDRQLGGIISGFEDDYKDDQAKLYLNSRSSLINRLAAVTDEEKLLIFSKILYVQALITGGYSIRSDELDIMNRNLIKLIEWGI